MAVMIALLVGFGLSYGIEVLQVFQPSRFSSLIDVLSNSTGTLLGFVFYFVWKSKSLELYLLVHVVLCVLMSIPLQLETSFGNWDTTFPFLLGNERTGDRPWRGHISQVYILDKAISEEEAALAFSEKVWLASMGASLLALFRLTGAGIFGDQAGGVPPLIWRGEPRDFQPKESVVLGPNHWLETATPATYLTERIIKTSQFTLGVTAATHDTIQYGPARIVSLSADPDRRNFTLGQEGGNLVFRLRTPLTGGNGAQPQLIVPKIFSTKQPQNLIITYNGSILNLYVNGIRTPQTLELTPGAAAFGYLTERTELTMKLCKILYYGFIFIPIGMLHSLTSKTMRAGFAVQVLITIGGIVLSSVILEYILVSVSGKSVDFSNLLLSIVFATASLIAFSIWSRFHKSSNEKETLFKVTRSL